MKTAFLALLAALLASASASVIVIDTDAQSIVDVSIKSVNVECSEFCAEAGEQCRARGLPRQMCDVVRGQCAHECQDRDDSPFLWSSGDCNEKCVDDAQKCREAGKGDEECHDKFIQCKDKCSQGKNVLSGSRAPCVGDSCRDNCHATKHRCMQSGMPKWQCEGDFENCYKDCSAPPSQLVIDLYANDECKDNCHATEHRCRQSNMPVWQCRGDYEHCIEGC